MQSSPGTTIGGTNPKQIGLGVSVGGIDTIFGDGAVQGTGKNTDLALTGNALFMVKQGEQTFYTRNGAFEFDAAGNYVLPSSGLYVQGWMNKTTEHTKVQTSGATENIVIEAGKMMAPKATEVSKYSENLDSNTPMITGYTFMDIDSAGVITGVYTNGVRRAEAQVAVAVFANPSGLTKLGGNLYQDSNNSNVKAVRGQTVESAGAKITPSSLEMSNVDLADQFSDMIITQRGFQSNSKIITVGDEMLETLINMKR